MRIRKNTSYKYDKNFYDFKTNKLINPIITQNYELIQVTNIFYASKFAYREHVQICDLEFTYTDLNYVKHNVNDKETMVSSGLTHVVFKNDKHSLKSDKPCKFYSVAINIRDNSPYKELLNKIKKKAQSCNNKVSSNKIENNILSCMLNTRQIMISPSIENYANLDCAITKILLNFILKEDLSTEVEEEKNIVTEALMYIDRNYLDISSIREIPNYLGCSYSYIARKFNNTYSKTINDYIMEKKMNYAKLLLNSGEYSVSQVAEELKFSSPYNFSRAFYNFYKIRPSTAKSKKIRKKT